MARTRSSGACEPEARSRALDSRAASGAADGALSCCSHSATPVHDPYDAIDAGRAPGSVVAASTTSLGASEVTGVLRGSSSIQGRSRSSHVYADPLNVDATGA